MLGFGKCFVEAWWFVAGQLSTLLQKPKKPETLNLKPDSLTLNGSDLGEPCFPLCTAEIETPTPEP